MRYFAMILSASLLLSVALLSGSGPGHAGMPVLALDRSAVADTMVEEVGYYYRRRHYGYRPYRYRNYGYGYRNYGYAYRNYGYGYRRPYVRFGYGRRWRY